MERGRAWRGEGVILKGCVFLNQRFSRVHDGKNIESWKFAFLLIFWDNSGTLNWSWSQFVVKNYFELFSFSSFLQFFLFFCSWGGDFELLIFLPLPPECKNYRHESVSRHTGLLWCWDWNSGFHAARLALNQLNDNPKWEIMLFPPESPFSSCILWRYGMV